MAEFIVSRKLRFRDNRSDKVQFRKMSPITEKIFRNSHDETLLKVLDPDPERATVATHSLMLEYFGIK